MRLPSLIFFLSVMAQPGIIGAQFSGFVHPIATGTFPGPVEDTTVWQQPAEEDLTSPLVPAKPMAQVPVTLPIMVERPSSAKPASFLKPIIVDEQDEVVAVPPTAVQPAEEDLTSSLTPAKPMHQVAVTLPIMVDRPTGSKPASFLKPIINEDEAVPTPLAVEQPAEEDLTSPLAPVKPMHQVAVTLPIMVDRPTGSKPASFLKPIINEQDDAAPIPLTVEKSAEEDLTPPPAKPMHQVAVTLPIMVERPSGAKPASFLRPIIVEEPIPTRKAVGQQKPAEEDQTSPLAPAKPVYQTAVTLPIMVERPSTGIPASYLRPIIVEEQAPVQKVSEQNKPQEEDLTSPLEPTKPMFQIPVTIPIMAERPPNAKPLSFLRPILIDDQEGAVLTDSDIPVQKAAGQQQPAEEDLTSPLEPTKPLPQIPVTIPIMAERPPSGIPSSYLRPIIIGEDNDPVLAYTDVPIRQTKPYFAPAEEDLVSPLPVVPVIQETANPPSPGVAVTLPFLLTPQKPASWLRPWLVESGPTVAPAEQQSIEVTRPFLTRNVAVTLPFALQSTADEGKKNKPSSYLRPIIWTTDAADQMGAVTLVRQQQSKPAAAAVPAEEDLTSPISGTVQASPNTPAVTLPFYLKPVAVKSASYLRPWFVDDSYLKPQVAVNIPYVFQADESITAARPQTRPFFVGNRFSDGTAEFQPSGAVQVRPLIATLLPEERPSASSQQRPLKPMKQLRPWIVQDYQQQAVVGEPVRQTKPWFAPVGQLRPIIVEDSSEPQYHLVRPLIALPAEVYPQDQQRPYILS